MGRANLQPCSPAPGSHSKYHDMNHWCFVRSVMVYEAIVFDICINNTQLKKKEVICHSSNVQSGRP
jgi:hypothetical protein